MWQFAPGKRKSCAVQGLSVHAPCPCPTPWTLFIMAGTGLLPGTRYKDLKLLLVGKSNPSKAVLPLPGQNGKTQRCCLPPSVILPLWGIEITNSIDGIPSVWWHFVAGRFWPLRCVVNWAVPHSVQAFTRKMFSFQAAFRYRAYWGGLSKLSRNVSTEHDSCLKSHSGLLSPQKLWSLIHTRIKTNLLQEWLNNCLGLLD